MAKTSTAYAIRVMRVALGVLYVVHALLTWAIFGLAHAAGVVVGAELLGGLILVLGLYTRTAAIGLMPVAIGAALVPSSAGIGISLSECLFFAACFAGQAVLASARPASAEDEEPYEPTAPTWSADISN